MDCVHWTPEGHTLRVGGNGQPHIGYQRRRQVQQVVLLYFRTLRNLFKLVFCSV